MILSLIVAADENNVIGKNNTIPWHLPDDLRYFRDKTRGHPVIMGRKTYESIGKPLPHRLNIIVTRNPDFHVDGCAVVSSLHDGIEIAKRENSDEVFVIGGQQIYDIALPIADRLYLTRVHTHLESGDAFFPEIPFDEWEETSRLEHPTDETHLFPFSFIVYDRVKKT